jgi:cation transport ATPase
MKQYTVTGMSCAACSSRVEKAVSKVPGVTACSVSLLTNSMGVEGDVPPETVIHAVEDAGYGASLKGQGTAAQAQSASEAEDALKDRETPVLKHRLIASLGFLAVLMYMSMGHMMWGWPLPHFMDGNHVAIGLLQLLLAGIIMVINLCIGMITPPMGGNLFVAQRVSNTTFEEIFKDTLPMILVLYLLLALLIIFPQITMFLPKLLGYVYNG